jgi:hypothetical protein
MPAMSEVFKCRFPSNALIFISSMQIIFNTLVLLSAGKGID